jgi:hypothetical protein
VTTEDIQALKASMRSTVMKLAVDCLYVDPANHWIDIDEEGRPEWHGPEVQEVAAEVRRDVIRILSDAWEAE